MGWDKAERTMMRALEILRKESFASRGKVYIERQNMRNVHQLDF